MSVIKTNGPAGLASGEAALKGTIKKTGAHIMSRSHTEQRTPMLSIYDGQICIGWVLERGRSGFEAFTAGERSLGVFETKDADIGECIETKTGTNKHECKK
jgi:hypothetical protein